MLYFLFGENSYHTVRKIKEFKNAFLKKGGESFSIEEINQDDLVSSAKESFWNIFSDGNLFTKTRLVIIKNILKDMPELLEFLEKKGETLKASKNVYVIFEEKPTKEIVSVFKKYAEKIQELKALSNKELDVWLEKRAASFGLKLSKEERSIMISEAGDPPAGGAEWALENELEKTVLSGKKQSAAQILQDLAQPDGASRAIRQQANMRVLAKSDAAAVQSSPFTFVEKIFSAPFGRALLALKEAESAGQDLGRLIYPLLWKAKQKKMIDVYWQGILAESAIRRDPKNTYEYLERFIVLLKA